jgi:hypothetical protein
MAGQFMIFCWNVCPINEQIVEILIHCSTENFQPEPQPYSEQKKLMECTSRPTIANAMLADALLSFG